MSRAATVSSPFVGGILRRDIIIGRYAAIDGISAIFLGKYRSLRGRNLRFPYDCDFRCKVPRSLLPRTLKLFNISSASILFLREAEPKVHFTEEKLAELIDLQDKLSKFNLADGQYTSRIVNPRI